MTEGPDRALRRLERTAVLSSAVMAAAALPTFGAPGVGGVAAGAMLAALNYLAVKGVVGVVVARSTGRAAGADEKAAEQTAAWPRRRGVAAGLVFILRYALLAIGAYVMLARLHLHPIGVIAGASAPVAAVAIEAIRMLPAVFSTGCGSIRSTGAVELRGRGPGDGGAESERTL
ncbi:MAG: hypothetical protein ACE148_05485 [Vicinamibacterales bacterium]